MQRRLYHRQTRCNLDKSILSLNYPGDVLKSKSKQQLEREIKFREKMAALSKIANAQYEPDEWDLQHDANNRQRLREAQRALDAVDIKTALQKIRDTAPSNGEDCSFLIAKQTLDQLREGET